MRERMDVTIVDNSKIYLIQFVLISAMIASQLNPDTVVQRNDSLLSTDLGDDVAMLDIDNGSYYALEATASRIWRLLEQPSSAHYLCGRLLNEYEVDPDRCESEVLEFLEKLLSQGILQTVDRQHTRQENEVAL
jgi:hypothetical protein